MRVPNYILPVFVSANLLADNHHEPLPPFTVGFTHFVFNSMSFSSALSKQLLTNELSHKEKGSMINETQYGFGIGIFLWMPITEHVVYKPKIEGTFANIYSNQRSVTFATSFDLSFSQGFAIALKPANKQGVICIARNMSCYLTSKQPYLLMGPKIHLKKYDNGFIHKGHQNEFSLGLFVGYGINYEFHGTNFAPEITYCVSSTSQNKMNDANKIIHTISLALNFF